MWSGKLWEEGYFVRTVGDKITGDVVRRYIKRHADGGEVIGEDAADEVELPGLF